MKFAIVGEHRDFFRKNGFIEFEGLITENQFKELHAEIQNTLALPSEKAFLAGRDLWRNSAVVKKYLLHNSLASIAAELCEHKPIRIGYDQFFPKFNPTKIATNRYQSFLQKAHPLTEMSSLDGVACGLILFLSKESPGRGIFFRADMPIDFGKFLETSPFILITYAEVFYALFRLNRIERIKMINTNGSK